jgi:hypothetical protein
LHTVFNISIQDINGIGYDQERQTLTATFPGASYSFPVIVENNGLTFTTGSDVAMAGNGKTYYDREVTKQLIDNFKSRRFTIDWSSHRNAQGLVVEFVSADRNFILPSVLRKSITN